MLIPVCPWLPMGTVQNHNKVIALKKKFLSYHYIIEIALNELRSLAPESLRHNLQLDLTFAAAKFEKAKIDKKITKNTENKN